MDRCRISVPIREADLRQRRCAAGGGRCRTTADPAAVCGPPTGSIGRRTHLPDARERLSVVIGCRLRAGRPAAEGMRHWGRGGEPWERDWRTWRASRLRRASRLAPRRRWKPNRT